MLIERQVAYVLLVPARSSGVSFRLLLAQKVPVVVLDRRVAARRVDSVRCGSEAGAYALTRHLIALGHRGILRHQATAPVTRGDARPLGAGAYRGGA